MINITKKWIALLLFVPLLLSGCQTRTEPYATDTFFAMDTLISVTYSAQDGDVTTADMAGVFEQIEKKLSRTIDNSSIARLNQEAGLDPVVFDKESLSLVEQALSYQHLTSSAFQPTILPLVELWNIADQEAPLPSAGAVQFELNIINNTTVVIDHDQSTVYLPLTGSGLDLGGIVKGYAADQLMSYLQEAGIQHILINAGGGIQASGGKTEEDPWRIGLQDPINPQNGYFATYELNNGAVVTSGNYQRYKVVDGIRYHHIIDPSTGYPAESGIAAATIFSKNSVDADALSTAVFVLGIDKGFELINSLKDIECLIVTEDKQVLITAGLENRITIIDEEFMIHEIR